jgi:hypothetical protein
MVLRESELQFALNTVKGSDIRIFRKMGFSP